jgi:inhibitor of cysteine peptidase
MSPTLRFRTGESTRMADLTLTDGDDGKEFRVSVGDRIDLQLEENPTTGYRWVFESDSDLLEPGTDVFTLREASAVGGGGIRHLQFHAVRPGRCTVSLKLSRGWELEKRAVRQFAARIQVEG